VKLIPKLRIRSSLFVGPLYAFVKGCLGEYLDVGRRKWRETGEDCIMRSFITCTLQIKENEVGGAGSTQGRDDKCTQNFSWNT